MKKIFSVFFILFTLHCQSQINIGIPDIEDVVTTFFTRYQFQYQTDFYLQFQKKTEGWYIGQVSYKSGELINPPQMFWNKSVSEYKNISYEIRQQQDSLVIKEEIDQYKSMVYLDEEGLYDYRKNLFYGYDGWDWDVINALQNKPNISDTLLESLARAYSNYAITFFYSPWGHSIVNSDTDRIKLKDSDPISITRVKKFLAYENLSIATYERLKQKNAQYRTKVGYVGLKKSNEQMFAYTTLRFIGYGKEAATLLPDISYPDSLLQIAQNVLNEVKPNSILFTYGDNISYPVWLLQARGTRKDVIAIDYSLLGLRRVVNFLEKKYEKSLFDVDSSVYMNPLFDYALYEKEYDNGKEISLDNFLRQLYCSNSLTTITNGNKTSYYTDDLRFKFFNKKVYTPVDPDKAKKLYGAKRFYTKIPVPVKKDYLFINDMISLSIEARNFLKKRIYFSYPVSDDEKLIGVIRHKFIWELTPEIK